MTKNKKLWQIGIPVVILALAAAAFAVFFNPWGRRDRPPLSDPANQSDEGAVLVVSKSLVETDWPRFRGPNGSGISSGANIPVQWSDTNNLAWKADLPGPGSSSPIVVGERVFVTCYSGYGTGDDSEDESNLKRHLVCLNRADGEIAWKIDIDAVTPENRYFSYLMEHGYASQTPVSDGEAVFAFFGKSGVYAFDLDGKELWHTRVGTRSDSKRWGSAASPILFNDVVIVNASSESRAIWALDKKTGEEVWKAPAESLDLSFNTPTLVELPGGGTELAVCVPGELWGLNPNTGTVNWYASVPMTGNVSPTVSAKDGIIYSTGGYRGKGSVAVKAGGHGDVTDTHVQWSIRESSYVASPLLHEGHLYWVDDKGTALCIDTETGEVVYEEKLGLSGLRGRPVYASPVLVGDNLIVVTRTAGTVVLPAKPEYELLHTNKLNDESDFNATPAISGDELFLRSNEAIYCIAAGEEFRGTD